jgi:WD repeat-containing protein 42A
MDPAVPHDYPFVCRTIIQTGHLANIFNAQMLPYSSNMCGRLIRCCIASDERNRATVAGDGQVRIHEVGEIGHSGPPADPRLSSRHTCIQRLHCHGRARVKRIATEDSPHLFLTVGEVRRNTLCGFGRPIVISKGRNCSPT